MDVASAVSMMLRDAGELGSWFPIGTVVVLLALALPVASIAAIRLGYVLGWAPLVVAIALYGWWFLYYATDWWANPGQGNWMAGAVAVLVGWTMFAVAIRAGTLSGSER